VRNTLGPQHLTKRDGIYYYVRRIPPDVRNKHQAYRFYFSLHTSSETAAVRAANSITQKLDAFWMGVRLEKLAIPTLTLDSKTEHLEQNAPLLSEAAGLYLRLKGVGRSKKFHQGVERHLGYGVQALGDRPIASFTAQDATKFRDWLLAKGLKVESVKRSFAALRAIINLTIREHGLIYKNPFSNTFMPNLNDRKRRKPIPLSDVRKLQSLCRSLDDDLRWLLAILSDTGLRLAEATGLLISEINLDGPIPYLNIKPHNWRPLKTRSSERLVPLAGSALWGARRAVENQSCQFAFPRYTTEEACNAASASAALNKWMKPYVPEDCVVHSFRHSMRDRLRAVECPPDITDAIGGWSGKTIGQRYGDGYPIDVLHKWMELMTNEK
jgi:integrase